MSEPTPSSEPSSYHPGGGAGLSSLLDALGANLSVIIQEAVAAETIDGELLAAAGVSREQPETIGRFRVLGEIGRGGIGVVYRVHDPELGRDLALKVLQMPFRGHAEACQRFIEECQIGGQLQHPGIVPIHEMGVLPGPLPYFTMKLVKGKTLAALLEARRAIEEDRQGLLSTFEQVAQTLAYAHSRGVIHRDLKPSNVMVGAFGELQVMDWGLAKVLGEGGVEDERRARKGHVGGTTFSVVRTVRSEGSAALSRAGSVLGTPCYMPPEQARGEIDDLDERSDVFGLGAILCEILTGKPPYAGTEARDVQAQAERADLAGALALLDKCDAHASLTALCRECLAPDPRLRPRDAGGVASIMRKYFDDMQQAALAAAEAAAEASVHARGARRARRLTAGIAASLILALAAGGGSYLYLERQRAERAAGNAALVEKALGESQALAAEARAAGPADLSRWPAALEAAAGAGALALQGGDAERARVAAARRGEIEGERDAAAREAARLERERAVAERLVRLRLRQPHLKAAEEHRLASEYAAAFQALGIDPRVPGAGTRIAATSVPGEAIRALDEWAAALRKAPGATWASWEPIQRAALDADRDGTANEVRQAILAGAPGRLEELARAVLGQPILPPNALELLSSIARKGADNPEAEPLPAPPRSSAAALDLLLAALTENDAADPQIQLARRAHLYHPGDFWLHHRLGILLATPGVDESLGHRLAVHAARADLGHTWRDLGDAYEAADDWDDAVPSFRRALELPEPGEGTREKLMWALRRTHDFAGAAAECRRLLEAEPGRTDLQRFLGETLLTGSGFRQADAAARELDQAIEALRRAVALSPRDAASLELLVAALRQAGRHVDAAAAARQLVDAGGGAATAYVHLGRALLDAERAGEAAAALEAAIERDPARAEAHLLLALARGRRGDASGFLRSLEQALDRSPVIERILYESEKALAPEVIERERQSSQGALAPRWREAWTLLRTAAQGMPEAAVGALLGGVQLRLRDAAAAAASFEKALATNGQDATSIAGLALARHLEARLQPDRRRQLLEQSLELLDRAEAIAPADPRLGSQHAVVLDDLGRRSESMRRLRDAAEGSPGDLDTQMNLARAFLKGKQLAEAANAASRVLASDEARGDAHHFLALVRLRQGWTAEQLKHVRRGLELEPQTPWHWSGLGATLLDARMEEARSALEEAVRLDPRHPYFQVNLGDCLARLGQYEEAARIKDAASAMPGCAREVFADLIHLRSSLGQPCAGVDALRRWIEHDRAHHQTFDPEDPAVILNFFSSNGIAACPELDGLQRALESTIADRADDPLFHQVFLETWLLKPFATSREPAAMARELAALSGGSEPGALRLLARVLRQTGRKTEALRALEQAARIDRRGKIYRDDLEGWRQELLPDLPSFETVDAIFERGEVLLGRKARLRFFPGIEKPSPPLAWVEPSFDDRSWAEEQQPFGYSYREATRQLEELQGAAASLYLRGRFTVPSLERLHAVDLALQIDAGVIVWINGREVGRLRAGAPGRAMAHDAAASGRPGDPYNVEVLHVPRDFLRQGENVIALHVLHGSLTDFGLFLDVEARGLRAPALEREQLAAYRAVASGDAALARASYLEGRILEREGRDAEAAAAFQASLVSDDQDASLPYLRLLATLRRAHGREDGEWRFRAALAGLRLPRALTATWLAEPSASRPDGGIEVSGPGTVLEAIPPFSVDPHGAPAVAVWEVWRAGDGDSTSGRYQSLSVTELQRLELPAGILEPATEYRWRVAYGNAEGTLSGFSAEASFRTAAFPWRLVPFDLQPVFNRDVIGNPGDTDDDGWDHVGMIWTVEGFDGRNAGADVRGLPPDGKVGCHQLADYGGKNCLQLSPEDREEVRIPAPVGSFRALRFLATGGGGGSTVALRLELAGAPPVRAKIECPDWTQRPWTIATGRPGVHQRCVAQGKDVLHTNGAERFLYSRHEQTARQLFETIVPLPAGSRLEAIVLVPRDSEFLPISRFNLLSLVGVETHE